MERPFVVAGWPLIAFFCVPFVFVLVALNNIYLSMDAHIWSARAAAVLCIPTFWLLRRSAVKRLGRSKLPRLGIFSGAVAVLAASFLLYGWSLAGAAAWGFITAGKQRTDRFLVVGKDSCDRGRCTCRHYLVLDALLPHREVKVCVAREAWASTSVGQNALVRAYFSKNSIYVLGVGPDRSR